MLFTTQPSHQIFIDNRMMIRCSHQAIKVMIQFKNMPLQTNEHIKSNTSNRTRCSSCIQSYLQLPTMATGSSEPSPAQFLAGLELWQNSDKESSYTEPSDDREAAYLAGISLVCFTEGVPPQVKQDLLNATMLAQLNAKKIFDITEVKAWFTIYRNVLNKFGFFCGGEEFNEFDACSAQFYVANVVDFDLKELVTATQLQLILKALESINALKDTDDALQTFYQHSILYNSATIQIILCSQVKDQPTEMLPMGIFQICSNGIIDHRKFFLPHSPTPTTTMHRMTQEMTFNREKYKEYRSAIVEKLGSGKKDYHKLVL